MKLETFGRLPELQHLIDLLKSTFKADTSTPEDVPRVAQTIFSALEREVCVEGANKPTRLKACSYFETALDRIRLGGPLISPMADVLEALEPKLQWYHPTVLGSSINDAHDNIANAVLIGPNGLERRKDVLVGITIMGPQTLYPNHQHYPEEIYRVLSEGEWRQNEGPWHEPGFGGTVYNPSNIIHAFRSKMQPLCAIWCLRNTHEP
ncbi:dimethylsulfonioproprionate lyase family protein [Kiloniella sp.]|uniref:dimethylsulfonioproprionate lyase family protein n=1 Tax=Kiloniella sp. TaxID=1938587 RepID=UPI003B01C803